MRLFGVRLFALGSEVFSLFSVTLTGSFLAWVSPLTLSSYMFCGCSDWSSAGARNLGSSRSFTLAMERT